MSRKTEWLAESETRRFLEKISFQGEDECWPWLASCTPLGYGKLMGADRKVKYAHRKAYEHFIGPIPSGMSVMHTCDNPPCCNPAHLRVGTHADNMHDRDAKGRGNGGKRLQGRVAIDRASISERRARGEAVRSIADHYGISVPYVYKILADEGKRQ